MTDLSDDLELLGALGVETEQKEKPKLSAREERVIAGFEEIQGFVESHGRLPQQGEDKDIFERLYAVRLERISQQEACRNLVAEIDYQGLLSKTDLEALDDESILSELGMSEPQQKAIEVLSHVKPRAETRVIEDVAERIPCEDFLQFKPIFEQIQQDLALGLRETKPFKDYAQVLQGDVFILTGQTVYVAHVGKSFINQSGKKDSRLRVIYDNGTESNILMRSLQRALNKDKTGRRVSDPSLGPLFEGVAAGDDLASGTIYVLRSHSRHPAIVAHKNIIHKIGVTGGDIKARIGNASTDPTFLMAKVEVVRTYELYNINRIKLESLLHRFFEKAKLDIEIPDRMGNPVKPKEWFLVPEFVIDEVVEKIKEGTLANFIYDVDAACLRAAS